MEIFFLTCIYPNEVLPNQRCMKQITTLIICLLFCHQSTHAQASFTVPPTVCANQIVTLTANSGTMTNTNHLWYAVPSGGSISDPFVPVTTISFSAANVYTIWVNVNNGVDFSYAQQTVTVLAAPSLTFSQNTYTSCITKNAPLTPKPVSITVTGSNSYTWSSAPTQGNVNGPVNVVTPTVASCYTVSSQNAQGCIGSAVGCVTILPRPAIQVAPTFTFLCRVAIGDPTPIVTLTMSNPASPNGTHTYTWSGMGNVSSPFQSQLLVSGLSTTSFTAQLGDAQNCISLPVVATVSVDICTGINSEAVVTKWLSFYPNPTHNKAFVSGQWNTPEQTIKLYTTIGQLLLTFKEPVTEIGLEDLPAGVYFLLVETSDKRFIEKVVKQE